MRAKRKRRHDEQLDVVETSVVMRLGELGRRSCVMPYADGVRYAKRFNRRMRRAGCEWRAVLIIEP